MSVDGSTVVADGWGWRFGASPSSSIDGVSFTIDAGERVLLLGPSGSGKSTLLRAIAGLLAEDEGLSTGVLTVDGQLSREQSGHIGFVMQDPETQAVMQRVGDDIAFGLENVALPQERIWPRVQQSLELVGLDLPLSHSTSNLSGGQKQRLALAGALATQPRLLLLDEPTANLDPHGTVLVRDSIERVSDLTGATVILVEHRLDIWWDFATRVIVLSENGGILADGSPENILSSRRGDLERAGIWLPDFHPPTALVPGQGNVLLSLDELVATRPGSPWKTSPVSTEVFEGELLAVTGANGVGKSTLALTLGGLIPRASGSLSASPRLAAGLSGEPFSWSSRALHTRIGSVFQSPSHQFVRATVRAELALSAKTANLRHSAITAAVDEMLERLNLTTSADAHPFALSGGQQRRLSVATALIAKPALLVLDEPTFGQDANTWRELVALIGELCFQGRAVVAMTHDPHLVASASSRLELQMSPNSAERGES